MHVCTCVWGGLYELHTCTVILDSGWSWNLLKNILIFKATEAEIVGLGYAWALGFWEVPMGNSNVQPRLRTTVVEHGVFFNSFSFPRPIYAEYFGSLTGLKINEFENCLSLSSSSFGNVSLDRYGRTFSLDLRRCLPTSNNYKVGTYIPTLIPAPHHAFQIHTATSRFPWSGKGSPNPRCAICRPSLHLATL